MDFITGRGSCSCNKQEGNCSDVMQTRAMPDNFQQTKTRANPVKHWESFSEGTHVFTSRSGKWSVKGGLAEHSLEARSRTEAAQLVTTVKFHLKAKRCQTYTHVRAHTVLSPPARLKRSRSVLCVQEPQETRPWALHVQVRHLLFPQTTRKCHQDRKRRNWRRWQPFSSCLLDKDVFQDTWL